MAKPLLKWAGGKRQLLPHLLKLVPQDFNTYFEPFLGGGAVFFSLKEKGIAGKAVLSDRNRRLYIFYKAVKENPEALVDSLHSIEFGNNSQDYYKARDKYNSLHEGEDDVLQATLLMYLNRHCFNGLYRVNSRGEFNVPFGKYLNPRIPMESHIMEISRALEDAVLLNEDFEEILTKAGDGDFVYLDPPYEPVSRTSKFTDYDPAGFDFEEQMRLAAAIRKLDNKGVKFILSNSSVDHIEELYSEFNIQRAYARRSINSEPAGRGRIAELVVTNF